ncbi:hypothetical protein O4H52_02295 [Sphingomonadaceae bacterium G21617-S1]|uniref:hypothetical protein n=1 Tax=Rhizorhabdus sp. TaxID=1968843 RepID=UPI0022C802B5|nr:hypothetical protein [Rhizorhabdus sp.]MCZ4340421.1 hypothetical protein [Sphingomonadaceae bacterium G21617-S1]
MATDPRFLDTLRRLSDDDNVTGGSKLPYDLSGPMDPKNVDRVAEDGDFRFYNLRNNGVVIPSKIKKQLNDLAEEFFYRFNEPVVVNSGYRSPAHQAGVMYDKIANRDGRAVYGNGSSGKALISVFDAGNRDGRSRQQIVGDMTNIIRRQMKQGFYVSKHLTGSAIDFKKPNGPYRNGVLRELIRERGHLILKEPGDDHIHTTFVIR